MAGRPGLYDELEKFNLLEQGGKIALGDGSDADKASTFEALLIRVGSKFKVTPRSVYIVRHKFQEYPIEPLQDRQSSRRSTSSQNEGTGKKTLHPHDGRRDNRPPPGPHGSAFKPGNDAATKTGEHRNPLLHDVPVERARLVAVEGELSPADIIRRSIEVHQLAVLDMTAEIEAIKASRQRWWWLGSTYKRQEGDGELMGTGRITERKRLPREEALLKMIEARARVQSKLDAALAKWYEMLKSAPPSGEDDPIDALVNALAESRRARGTQQGGDGT